MTMLDYLFQSMIGIYVILGIVVLAGMWAMAFRSDEVD